MWPFSRRPARSDGAFRHLVPGRLYDVVTPFLDHDGIVHPLGETWTFLESNFLPYEDGLTLHVAMADGAERTIRLQWRPDAEGPIIDALETYAAERPAERSALSLPVTRDSVCLADDIDAPHADVIEVDPGADARGIAHAVMTHGIAWRGATWQITVGGDDVVFGWRHLRRFVLTVRPWSGRMRARDISELHVVYHAQRDPDAIVRALEQRR